MLFKKDGVRGQVTLFIILSIVIISVIVLFFMFKDSFFGESINPEFRPIYNDYLSCLEGVTREGILLLGQQGGYIETPERSPASNYMPFSSQLDFVGQPVPYWYYISGNNLVKEQVPTKSDMELQLKNYISERLSFCDLNVYDNQGYNYILGNEGVVDVRINDLNVDVSVNNKVSFFFEDKSASIENHEFVVSSKLGKFYDYSKSIYDLEKQTSFLEKYVLDVLVNYVPVSGFEIQCNPLVFDENEIKQEVTDGLVTNLNSIRIKGDYYNLDSLKEEYFVVDNNLEIREFVNVLYSSNWPKKIEIKGDLINEPVGIQEGLDMFGFCYVPYKLNYDVYIPVMIQFMEDDFLFQFPIIAFIENNQVNDDLNQISLISENRFNDVCEDANSEIVVNTFDYSFNPVEAYLSFECLESNCVLGTSELEEGSALFEGNVPQCVNGVLIATAPGYVETKKIVSTNKENVVDLWLRKKYLLDIEMNNLENQEALITFSGENYSTSIVYPEMNSIELVEDSYNISVLVYSNSSLNIPETNEEMCFDVPIGDGSYSEERCEIINVESMSLDSTVIGGGSLRDYYVTEDILVNSNKLSILPTLYDVPNTLEELQQNYINAEDSYLFVSFE